MILSKNSKWYIKRLINPIILFVREKKKRKNSIIPFEFRWKRSKEKNKKRSF